MVDIRNRVWACPFLSWVDRLRARAHQLKSEAHALFLAFQNPRTPWYAKAWLALVLGYLASPVDIIPDFIPVLGHLDDLVLVPAGLALATRMIPTDVLAECRRRAASTGPGKMPASKRPLTVAITSALVLAATAALLAYTCVSRAGRQQAPAGAVAVPAWDTALDDSASWGGFRFDLVCRRPDAPLLLNALAKDGFRIVDVDSMTDLTNTVVGVQASKERFAVIFRPRLITRRVAISSGDGFCDLEYLDGYSIPEKYRPLVSEVRLPNPQVE